MTDEGSTLAFAELPRVAATVAPATLCLVAGFIGASAGVLLASTVPGWLAFASVAVALLSAGVLVWSRGGSHMSGGGGGMGGGDGISWRGPAARAAGPLAVLGALFAWALWTEQTRQAANFAISEQIFREALPPFDTVGTAPRPDDRWLIERDLPRIRIVRITGVVVEAPPPPEPRQVLANLPRVYRVRTESLAGVGGPVEPLSALIRLSVQIDSRWTAAATPAAATAPTAPTATASGGDVALYPLPGQRVEALVRLVEVRPGRVAPGQFDAELQWLLDGVHAHASIDPRQWHRLPDDGGFSVVLAARRAQAYFAANINRHMQGREADTLRALCWGDSSDLTDEDRRSFQQTGTVHLLAISGLHIYVVLYLLLLLTRPLFAARPGRYVLLAALLWIYAGLTGFHEPVLRAVLMFTLWIGARALQRRFDALNAWAVSGLAILFASPQSAHTVGFQLSFVTVGMLIWWAPAVGDWLHERAQRHLARWLLPTVLENVCRSLAAGLVALVATLPLVIFYFGVAPGWAVLANLVLIPLFELILILGLPLSLWFCISEPGWPAALLQRLTGYALDAADGLAAGFGAPTDAQPPAVWALVLAVVVLVAAGWYFRRTRAAALGVGAWTGSAAVRRQFAYPSFALVCGGVLVIGLALSGAAAPPVGGEVLVLGRHSPCVVVVPELAGTPAAAAGTGPVTWQAYAPVLPDSPGSVESSLRRPIARWHPLQAPDVRETPRLLTPSIVLFCDGPAAREQLTALLNARAPEAGPVLLLVYLTADSDHAPKLLPGLTDRLQAQQAAVVLLDSPWRLLEPDGQAWLRWGEQSGRAVIGADAAALWRIAPDGRSAQLCEGGSERQWRAVAEDARTSRVLADRKIPYSAGVKRDKMQRPPAQSR